MNDVSRQPAGGVAIALCHVTTDAIYHSGRTKHRNHPFLHPCHLDEMNDYIEINKKGGALLYIIIGDTCSKNKTPGM